jgi:hypothetical protein
MLAAPSQAQSWYQNGPSIYQAPDGSYDSLADYTRDIWGIPCGMDCTRRAQARWYNYYGRYNARHYGGYRW